MAPRNNHRLPYGVQLTDQDQKMIDLLARLHARSKQDVLRYAIDMLHAHMTRARLDFPGL